MRPPSRASSAPAADSVDDAGERARAAAAVAPLDGLTLSDLRAFIDAHNGRAVFEGKTTEDVKQTVVKPRAEAWGGAYTEELRRRSGSGGPARANVFVSHVYSGLFLDAVDALEAWEARQAAAGAPFAFYFDLLVVDQRQDAVVPF